RGIFEWRATRWSGKRIAQTLNARQLPAPGAAWKRIQDVRSQSARTAVEDPDELITQQVERLGTVSDELWSAVHVIQSARPPRSEAIRAAKRRQGRGPA